MAEMADVNNMRTEKRQDHPHVTHHNLPQENNCKDSAHTNMNTLSQKKKKRSGPSLLGCPGVASHGSQV